MTGRFNPPSGWPQNGRAFNHGVVCGEGRTLHMTGQVAWDHHGTLIGVGDCEKQVRQCFVNVESILMAVGGRLSDIVSLTIFFLRTDDLPQIQKVRAEKFTTDDAPASILIQTLGLVVAELLVELVPIAVIPDDRYHDPKW
jgi:enamine deaminase RidA (YjgF/YER057c/UK114 family)